jgi:NADPH:quinone reductase-like Zn-dependent oxidoreductase
MREVLVTRHGPPAVLRLREAADPIPVTGEVRIAVRAAGINFVDILARMGIYPDAPAPPSAVT